MQGAGEIPGLLAQAPPDNTARGREGDSLFVHLSLSGQPSDYQNLAHDLVEAIGRRYYETRGSVTAALRTAILQANQLLLNFNVSRTGVAREGAITCAVLRGQELFVVQAGEALALIGHNFGLERLPPQEPDRITAMGRTAGLDLRYYHNWLEPGDMLLLADPRVSHLPAESLQSVLVDSTVEDSIPLLAQILEDDTARLLLVEFIDETPVGIPETVTPLASGSRDAQGSDRVLSPPARQPRRAGHNADPAPDKERRGPPVSMPDVDLPSVADFEHSARQATSRTALGLSRLTGWLADLMRRLRPGNGEDRSEESEAVGWALPTLLAVAIPLIVALIVGSVYVQRGRVTRVSEIRSQMQQAIGLAEQAGTEAEAREQYVRALNLAVEAQMLRPGDQEIGELQRQAQSALDRIDDVSRLNARLLYQYDEENEMAGVVLREGLNGDIYTLDSANNRAFVHQTEEDYVTFSAEDPEEILFGGQAVGTHVVGELVDMMWRPSGTQVSTEGLAVLDTRGALISYHPSFSNLRAVPLGLSSDWLTPQAISQFNERLYVLDVGAGQIWRYFAEGDGFYVDEGQRALSLPDLDQAQDFTIYSEDGSVVVLYADGRLRRYGQDSLLWSEVELAESGLETPLVAPTRMKIIGSGLNSSIFVADPGSARIVQFSLGGTFLAQYKATGPDAEGELFSTLGGFDVADAPLRIFVASANGLYVATQE